MPVSLSEIARACEVSTATVSRALSGHPYVAGALRERIRTEAKRLGYRQNPLVGSLMAHVRRARTDRFLGNLALVHVSALRSARIGPQQQVILDSVQARVRELGFSIEVFRLGPDAREEAVLTRVLRARGVSGVLFAYPQPSELPREFPWAEFSVLALDFASRDPRLDTVCHDHYASITRALAWLRAAGYRRAGLFLERFKDARTNYKWSAAFRSFQLQEGGVGRVPVLMVEAITEMDFAAWFCRHRPDVVLGHFDSAVNWMATLQRNVPGDVGFFSLNWRSRTLPCAGIDPQLELQGRVAAETLISRVQHGDRGLLPSPRLISVPGLLVEGPTVRAVTGPDRPGTGANGVRRREARR
ncbi:MAG: LacI family DNA-binding transcriptional regulator [Opitutaceae bacterium]